jgi:hypothetical protein
MIDRRTRILLAQTSPGAIEIRITGIALLLLFAGWLLVLPAIHAGL